MPEDAPAPQIAFPGYADPGLFSVEARRGLEDAVTPLARAGEGDVVGLAGEAIVNDQIPFIVCPMTSVLQVRSGHAIASPFPFIDAEHRTPTALAGAYLTGTGLAHRTLERIAERLFALRPARPGRPAQHLHLLITPWAVLVADADIDGAVESRGLRAGIARSTRLLHPTPAEASGHARIAALEGLRAAAALFSQVLRLQQKDGALVDIAPPDLE